MVENKVTKNKYFYATAVIAATTIGVLILFFAVISPFFTKAQELTAESKARSEEYKKLEDKKAKLEELKSREEELKKEAETVKNALPEGKDVGRLFIQLDNMAKATGGSIKSVTEGSGGTGTAMPTTTTTNVGSAATGLQKITYSVPVEFRDYFGMKEFITKTETALRIVGIDTINISVTSGTSLSASINTTTYVRN